MAVLSPPTLSLLLQKTKIINFRVTTTSSSHLLLLLTPPNPSSSLTPNPEMGWPVRTKKSCLTSMAAMLTLMSTFLSRLLRGHLGEKSKRRKDSKEQPRRRGGKQVQDPPEDPKPPRTTHKLLQVLGGTARRVKLLSPKGMDVRPMMEVVKGAAFDILQAAGGCPAALRPGHWLDLYSGTGSVGIEALSRGCSEVHLVEMDPWVVSDVLRPNLEETGFLDASVIHTVRVEKFFERAEQFVGNRGPFDYISVTPPYTQVDYGVLMRQISESSLIGENTFIVVEYALKTDMLDSCGSLVKITDRRFGRTLLAIYGPTWSQNKR
ncbi:hypothetical protein AAZX31_19G016100 [Glycine max]